MPLPLILGVGAAIAGVAGVRSGIKGATKMKDANDTMKDAEIRHKDNIEKFDTYSERANKKVDELGELELGILKEFDIFSNTIEKIQNRPVFKEYNKDGVKLPQYDKEELKKVSVGAGVLLGGLATLSMGSLVGGMVFNAIGEKMSDKADEAWNQMKKAEETIDKACKYLDELSDTAEKYIESLTIVYERYQEYFDLLSDIVNRENKVDWNEFSEEERLVAENTVLLVGLLYKMCKVSLVKKSESVDEENIVNTKEVNKAIRDSEHVLDSLAA